MSRTDELLLKTVEQFLKNKKYLESPILSVKDAAKKMVAINMYEFWVLTQE